MTGLIDSIWLQKDNLLDIIMFVKLTLKDLSKQLNF